MGNDQTTPPPERPPSKFETAVSLTPLKSADDPLVGQCLAHYEIRELIGKGGMGVVYRAFDEKLERDVAIKVLPAELTADAKLLQRFLNEARAAAQLTHPHVAAIHGIEQHEGRYFIIMELLEGGDLAGRLARHGALPVRDALLIAKAATKALAAAHARKIIHRDIKPANIMFTGEGIVKVADFGLAKIGGDTSGLTTMGSVLGTPLYMSPEQCQGLPADARSDVYSLGATFFAMLANRPPFAGDSSVAVMFQQVHEAAPVLSEYCTECPPAISRIVSKCLAKMPADRYPSAAELLEELEQLDESDDDLAGEALQFHQAFYARPGDSSAVRRRIKARQDRLDRLQQSQGIPSAPACRLLDTKSDVERVTPLARRNLSTERLAAAKRALDNFSFGRRGMPANLSALVRIARAAQVPVVRLRLSALVGVLEFRIEADGGAGYGGSPEQVRWYGKGKNGRALLDEVVEHGGNLFDKFGPRSREQAEPFAPVAVLAPEACPDCAGKGTRACDCEGGIVLRAGGTPVSESTFSSAGRSSSGEGSLSRQARRNQPIQTCGKCGGLGYQSCPTCGGGGNSRPVLSMRRVLKKVHSEDTRCELRLPANCLGRCNLDTPFFRQEFVYPTIEDLRQRLSNAAALLAAEVQAAPQELDLAPLVDQVAEARNRIAEEAAQQNDSNIPERFEPLFRSGPACGPGLIEGPTTTRILAAEMSISAAFVDRLEVIYDDQRFEVLILPDGGVVADQLADRVRAVTRAAQQVQGQRSDGRLRRRLAVLLGAVILLAGGAAFWLWRSGYLDGLF